MGCFFSKPQPESPETPIYRFNTRSVITQERVDAWDLFCNQKKFTNPDISQSKFDHKIKSEPIDIPCASRRRSTRTQLCIIVPVSHTRRESPPGC